MRGDCLRVLDLRLHGHHGVTDAEQADGGPYAVDVEVRLDLAPAGRSDALTDTLDYGEICQVVEQVNRARFRLIEAFAERVAQAVLALPGAQEVTVRVRKLQPPLPQAVACAEVEIVRGRVSR